MIPERIKNAINNYNFYVEVYLNTISKLNLSDGSNIQKKWKLLEELFRREIDLMGVINGYNILANELQVKPVKIVAKNTYETATVTISPILFATPVDVPFTIQTYKLKE